MVLNKKSAGCIAILLHLLIWTDVSLSQSKVGTTAASFLGITVGARATAMGSAFTAVSGDATSLYYNPGAIAMCEKSNIIFSHTDWFVGTDFTWFGLVYKIDRSSALGLSVTQLDYGEEEVNTVTEPEGTGENWAASDLCASVSFARSLSDRFAIGGSVKYIQQKIWHEKATAVAVDIGLLFITEFNDMKLGMSISNFGSDLKMSGKDLLQRIDLDPDYIGNNETIVGNLKTDAWPLPLFFRVGLSMDVLDLGFSHLILAADALRPSDNTEVVNVGCEYALLDMLFLRAGYKSLFREDSEEGLTYGAGLNLDWQNRLSVFVDYTYYEFGILGDIQMFSVGINF